MKKKIFIAIALFISTLCFAQQNTFNKETELQRFAERGGIVEETSPNIYTLTYPDGLSRVYNLNHKEDIIENLEGVDETIINIWEIDTTLYADKFSFWQKVDIANNELLPVFVDDLNFNKLPELYGFSDRNRYPAPPTVGPVEIYELNNEGIFESVFEFDSTTIFVHGMGDIHGTGGKEIFMRSRSSLNGDFYRSDTISALPTSFDFIFYYEPNQIMNMTFGDFDKNGITDCAFVDGSNPSKVIIGEFRDSINNFITNYELVTEGDVPQGFAIDDFDQDGKTELVVGTLNRSIYVIENQAINSYAIVWQGLFSTYNAYMNTETNDIDKNGKPEFWIGGQDFVNGITRFQCYESVGDNSYEQVAMIEIRYLVSFDANYIQSADIDNDGVDELIISLGQLILILKFAGSQNEHIYDIYYVKYDELTQPGSTFYPLNIYDLNGDGWKDILLPMDIYISPHLVSFTYLLTQNKTNSVRNNIQFQEPKFNIHQNYPNPFNSTTRINFIIPKTISIKVKVFNILGKEVKLLLEKEYPAGEYSIDWDGTDDNGNILNSGVYFITMEAENFHRTIKTILIK